MRRQLPTLNIASPCHEPTENMHDVEGGRHCFACNKKVVDLSKMTADEAEALFIASGEDLCGEVETRTSGALMFPSKRVLLAAGMAASMMVGCGSMPPATPVVEPVASVATPTPAVKQTNETPCAASSENEASNPTPEAPTVLTETDDAGNDVDAGPPRHTRGRISRVSPPPQAPQGDDSPEF